MKQGVTGLFARICSVALITAVISIPFSACSQNKHEIKTNETKSIQANAPDEEPKQIKETVDPAKKALSEMTLEEKVGQVFIMSLRYLPDTQAALEVTDTVKDRIKKNHLGGVILFSENLKTIPQTKKLITDMQGISKLPMFVAIDEEGGSTSRLNKNLELHSTVLPTNREIGKTGNPELAQKAANVIAEEISSLGFNMDFAPIADVDSNPKNPIIGIRSFGPDQKLVAEMVKAQVRGMQETNIITVLKHFPGHGDTSTDTHMGTAVVQHDKKRLNKVEFVPFIEGIEAGADGIMTAHIQVPKITKDNLPATLSKKILTDILRNEMGFKGLIITDALEMKAISNYYPPDEAAVKAFEAGADILLMPYSIEAAYQSLLKAVQEKRISEERLDESVLRILDLKAKKGILEHKKNDSDPEKVLGNPEHRKIAEEIAKAAKGK
ncbi:MAG: glycoside hydrolase family 3 protein [Clostridia bacterium]|nr:glycoside hydrolase family 3 protein [Clostridia bacterium]